MDIRSNTPNNFLLLGNLFSHCLRITHKQSINSINWISTARIPNAIRIALFSDVHVPEVKRISLPNPHVRFFCLINQFSGPERGGKSLF